MVDLRKEMSSLMREFPTKVLIIRRDEKEECDCTDTLYKSSNDNCPICLGTGYVSNVSIASVRINTLSDASGSAEMTKPSIGNTNISLKTFFFEYDINIKVEDIIIVCEWDNDKPIISNFYEFNKISSVIPLYGDNGRIEFVKALGYTDSVNKVIKLHQVINNIGMSKYYLGVK